MGLFDAMRQKAAEAMSAAGVPESGRSVNEAPQPGTPYAPCRPDAGEEFWDAVRKPTPEDISAAWRRAIAQYGLYTDSPDIPMIIHTDPLEVSRKTQAAYWAARKHDIDGARIYGWPGGSTYPLFWKSRDFDDIQGSSVAQFAKLLTWDGILDRCVSYWYVCSYGREYWNVFNPAEYSAHRHDFSFNIYYDGFIDCILKFGNHLLLVDVKNYRADLDYHTLIPGKAMFCTYQGKAMLFGEYQKDRVVAHEPYIFSKKIAVAQRGLSQYLALEGSPCTVESFVVLVPGPTGEATLDPDIQWPGNIPAMKYSTFKAMIAQRAQEDSSYAVFDPAKTAEEGYLASETAPDYYLAYCDDPLFSIKYNRDTLSYISSSLPPEQWPKPTYDKLAGIHTASRPKHRSANTYKGKSQAARNNKDYETAASQNPKEETQASDCTQSQGGTNKRYAGRKQSARSAQWLEDFAQLHNGSDLEILEDASGAHAMLSFKDVSAAVVAGWHGSGSVVRMQSVIASLIVSQQVEVEFIDCLKTSCFEQLEESCYSYCRLMDGLDLVTAEVQSAYVCAMSRTAKLKKKNLASFWDDPSHGGEKFRLLVINESANLFGSYAKADTSEQDDDAQQQMSDINRYLRKIISDGPRAGVCAMLMTQRPAKASLPEFIVEGAQMHVCFYVPYPNLYRVIMGANGTKGVAFGDKPVIGQAFVAEHGDSPKKLTFLGVDPDVIKERFEERDTATASVNRG